jgi:hypothetical protein
MAKKKLGRASMFGDLRGGRRLQGIISKQAAKEFEKVRKNLGLMASAAIEWSGPVSDAAVIEFLTRGVTGTINYWKKGKK